MSAEGISKECPGNSYSLVAVLSGLEPQRTLFEEFLINRYRQYDKPVLLVRGKMGLPNVSTQIGSITLVPYMNDDQLFAIMLQAEKIVVRSGYSTIMDLAVLGLLDKAEFHPTPGQTEQEYLAQYHNQ